MYFACMYVPELMPVDLSCCYYHESCSTAPVVAAVEYVLASVLVLVDLFVSVLARTRILPRVDGE